MSETLKVQIEPSERDSNHFVVAPEPRRVLELHANPESLSVFRTQAEKPPGSDKYIAACYKAVVQMYEEDFRLRNLLQRVESARNIQPAHLVNLFLRAMQHRHLLNQNEAYPEAYSSSLTWRMFMNEVLSDPDYAEVFENDLKTRDTTTTVYARYASLPVLSHMLHDGDLTFVEGGCSALYIRGLEIGVPFGEVKDHTSQRLISEFMNRRLQNVRGTGVDRENTMQGDGETWRLSCQFYPSELGNIPKVREFEQRIQSATNTVFLQGDLTDPTLIDRPEIKPLVGRVKLLPRLTVDYQLDEELRDAINKNLAPLLAPDGLIVVQDFAFLDPHNPTKLYFHNDWGQPFSYGTFVIGSRTGWEYKEVLRWSNGRCKEVKDGQDVSLLYK